MSYGRRAKSGAGNEWLSYSQSARLLSARGTSSCRSRKWLWFCTGSGARASCGRGPRSAAQIAPRPGTSSAGRHSLTPAQVVAQPIVSLLPPTRTNVRTQSSFSTIVTRSNGPPPADLLDRHRPSRPRAGRHRRPARPDARPARAARPLLRASGSGNACPSRSRSSVGPVSGAPALAAQPVPSPTP
jgi:hypothetical protein